MVLHSRLSGVESAERLQSGSGPAEEYDKHNREGGNKII